MKIAIFENQWNQVKTQFEVANKVYFNDELIYTQYNSSQELKPFEDLYNFDLVIIDISLSSNSDLDGFDLISKILERELHPRLLILTGNSNILENLGNRNLPRIPVLMKPVDVLDIKNKIISVMK
jgi:ActR/RegA family two-component response regulator